MDLNLDEKEELILGKHLLALQAIWIGRGEVLRLHDWKTAISPRRYFKNMHIKKALVSEDNSSASMKKIQTYQQKYRIKALGICSGWRYIIRGIQKRNEED